MALTIDGSSLVFEGTVTLSNASAPQNGVATLLLTPTGGVGTLPALLAGTPGLPPVLTVGTVTTLSSSQQATFGLVQTSAGGAGSASAYTVNVGIPQGQTGAAGTNSTLAGSSDINASPTPVVGNMLTVASLSPTKFNYTAFPFGFVVNPSTITSVPSTVGQATVQMASVAVAAQPFAWMPICLGGAIVSGTVNTVVNLLATLTAGLRVGDVVGQANGYAGQATQSLSLNSGFGATVSPSSAYGVVTANTAATIYFKAIETASTPDSWSVPNTTASFTVVGLPV